MTNSLGSSFLINSIRLSLFNKDEFVRYDTLKKSLNKIAYCLGIGKFKFCNSCKKYPYSHLTFSSNAKDLMY